MSTDRGRTWPALCSRAVGSSTGTDTGATSTCSSTGAGSRPSGRTPARRVPGPTWSTWRAGCCRPGFTDAHVHPSRAGSSGSAVTCRSSTPARSTSTRSPRTPPRTRRPSGSSGGGWAMAAFPGGTPTAADLDAVAPDRPVFLHNRDHHGAWVNSRALELAGVDRDTPDPADGRIERDEDGRPYRQLHEGATSLVARSPARPPARTTTRRCSTGQAYLHSLGVTGWQDAIVGAYDGMDDPASTYERAAGTATSRRTSSARSGGSASAASSRSRTSSSGGRRWPRERFRATSVKIMQDGVAENGTAAMTAPYLDLCGHADRQQRALLHRARGAPAGVAALDAAGFQVHVHAIGDRGVREALDAFVGTDPRPATPHRARAAHPPRRRGAVRRAGSRREPAGAVGLPRGPDGRPDAARARTGALHLAVPVRVAAPVGRAARHGERLAGVDARPAGRDPHRRHPHDVRRGGPGRPRTAAAGAGPRPRRPRSRRTRGGARGSTTATTRA